MHKYRTAVLGTGVRGRTHLKGLLESGRFEIIALCDLDEMKMRNSALIMSIMRSGQQEGKKRNGSSATPTELPPWRIPTLPRITF